MGDLISRSYILKTIEMWMKVPSYSESERNIMRAIDYEVRTAPSAEPPPETCWWCNCPKMEEPKKGRWIRNDNGTFSCSVCQSWIPEEQHCYARYCLYCGAEMGVTE